jgi:NitT/TauT family transport system substrate-binding protein
VKNRSILSAVLRVSTLAVALAGLAVTGASAQTVLKVGRSQALNFSFTPVDVGIEKGIFAKHGLTIESYDFGGDAKMQQGMSSGAVDIGIGSGPGLSAAAKGAPVIGIAAMMDRPKSIVLVVRNDGPQTVEELKGKTVSVSTAGSLTDWVTHQLVKKEGWQPEDLNIQPLGASSTAAAALKTGQTDGMVVDLATAYLFEDEGAGRILVRFGDIVEHFHNHVIFARAGLAKENPDAIRGFMEAWFETVQYMKDHKDETLAISGRIMGTTPETTAKLYDELIGEFNMTGQFNDDALHVIEESLIENGTIPGEVDMSKITTNEFLPAAAQ